MKKGLRKNDKYSLWPDGHRFALCLTHDVDRVDKSWWHCIYYFLKTKDPYQLRSLLTRYRDRPYWNFEKIMRIEERYGVRSTFFFLNESKRVDLLHPHTYALALGNYKIYDKKIIEIIRILDAGGWEIGVHGSFDSYFSEKKLLSEKNALEKILNKPIRGIRQHYLNLNIPDTWILQKNVGFRYDASFGLRDRADFREGGHLPFFPLGDKFLEIPLAIMDGPLFANSNSIEEAWNRCKQLIDVSEKQGFLLTILWHNNRFDDREYPGQARVYEKIINECKMRDAWIATGSDIYEWWATRGHEID